MMTADGVQVKPGISAQHVEAQRLDVQDTDVPEATESLANQARAAKAKRLRKAQEEFNEWLFPNDSVTSEIRNAWLAQKMLDMLLADYERGDASLDSDETIKFQVEWECAASVLRRASYGDQTHLQVQIALDTLHELGIIDDSGPYLDNHSSTPDSLYYVFHDVRLHVNDFINGDYRNM